MTTYNFFDDYSEGAHPEVLRLLADGNLAQQAAYGADAHTADAVRLIRARLGDGFQGGVHFVASGTLANLVSIAACLRPHEAVIAATSGHIVGREAGAVEATGHKVILVPPVDGKLTPAGIEAALAANSHFPHMAKPRMVYLSNATESGTVYSLAELRAISALARARGLLVFVDGARLGAALASPVNDATLADIAALVDLFWIGGTKTGALLGEAIVVCNPAIAEDFAFHVKQRGGLLAKGRVLGVQFQALFGEPDLFTQLARHANATAAKLSAGIVAAGHTLAAATQTNQVFAALPADVVAALQAHVGFHVWERLGDGRVVVRLVTSWATPPAQVDGFLALLSAR